MPYPFLSALTDLDSRVQAAEAQLARLDAALPFEEQSLLALIQDANLHAARLADLIRAERPGAEWDDRAELDSLLQQLELDAEAKRREQRCARLLELAEELHAGQVKHRFESRTAQLNALRLRAVDELRAQAALPVHAKELPGPAAREWLNWAFNLKDDEDAAVIAQLRQDFGALEEFAGEMEGIYWHPARPTNAVAAATVLPAPPAPAPAEISIAKAPPAHVASEARDATVSAGPSQITAPEAEQPNLGAAPVDPLSPKIAEHAPAMLAESETLRERTPEEALRSRKRLLVAFGSFLLLSALFFAIIYHLHARNASKQASTVQAASVGTTAASPTSESDPGPEPSTPARPGGTASETTAAGTGTKLPLLHKQPAEGAQDSIAISLEQCGRGPSDHLECWGYVSNVGAASSKISLDRVDIVDSRGNSFSLDRDGQLAFPNGRSSDVAPGAKVKFTVKVPDSDADARTLTLYMDLSNPRNLEYTFRDVPIAR